MSDVYEVAFSGRIAEDADLQQVKTNIANMFKADDAKLAQLFSGKRIVIKKNIDQATAMKYQAAMNRAGAVCEVVNLSAAQQTEELAPSSINSEPEAASPAVASAVDYSDRDIPPAPQTVPLEVQGDQIADLGASLAPVGSVLGEEKNDDVAPPVVPDDLSMAPVGTELGERREEKTPPPPDTSGLSIVE